MSAALYLAPALLLASTLLVLTLLARRYPGERVLVRIAAGRRPPRRRRAPDAAAPRRARPSLLPRGGSLLAFALAVRPPPALASAS